MALLVLNEPAKQVKVMSAWGTSRMAIKGYEYKRRFRGGNIAMPASSFLTLWTKIFSTHKRHPESSSKYFRYLRESTTIQAIQNSIVHEGFQNVY